MLCTALLLVLHGAPDFKDRERHPLAPSLPLLTKHEEQKIESIIDRFIQYDIGKLKGTEGKKALADFNGLGREATFQLINGLNRTANLEESCPAVIIAKKLAGIFLTTNDIQLLTFAKENIGSGVTARRHLDVVQDLRLQCQLRRTALQRQASLQGGPRSVASLSLPELEKAAGKQRGAALKVILIEAEKRQGVKAVDILLTGIAQADLDVVKLSKDLLAKNLHHQTPEALKELLRHGRRDVRIASAQAIGSRKLRLGTELISLLQDGDSDVRQAARGALVQLSGGRDFGPATDASVQARESAVASWREWWTAQK